MTGRQRLAVIGTLIALSAAPGAYAQPGPPSSVAFQSNRDGNNNIYVMNADGSDQVRLTFDSSNNQRAEVSPDGRSIVFASNRSGGNSHFEIFVMNADGGDVRQLTSTPVANTNTWPRWSPDGAWIAFQSDLSGAFQIYLVPADGSADPTRITFSGVNQFPAWSPDGTRLAMRRNSDIYVMDLAGGPDPGQLTTAAAPAVNQMAAWSPDGTQIAFMSTREPGNYPSVFVMNADGTGQRDLTPKLDSGVNTWRSRAPAWSPNGAYIYFTGVRPQTGSNEQIFVMRGDGTDQTPLTSAGVNAEATVRHVLPPTITSVTATPNVLWPADNRIVQVSIGVAVSDDSDPSPTCRITDVASNEVAIGTAWEISGPLTVDLLAQRFGWGTGRVYTIRVACTNSSELSSTGSVTVSVPHDQGPGDDPQNR